MTPAQRNKIDSQERIEIFVDHIFTTLLWLVVWEFTDNTIKDYNHRIVILLVLSVIYFFFIKKN